MASLKYENLKGNPTSITVTVKTLLIFEENAGSTRRVKAKEKLHYMKNLRLRRICSINNELQISWDKLHNKLIERRNKQQKEN